MAKKKLPSGLELSGIAPNILLQQVAQTAPFLFSGELDSSGEQRAYLAKLRFYKKNLKALAHIDLAEYFHICMAAHWATAGTFVPTDVDQQIREGLWKHQSIAKYMQKMVNITIAAWQWDYRQVTNRKSYNNLHKQTMSTHEGTWLSVAIGAYCATLKQRREGLAAELAQVILQEITKEQNLLLQLREDRDHLNFLKAAPLMAHNFGDLDRVMVQWNTHLDDPFCKKIFKLGHQLNAAYSPVLVYAGQVNKAFTAHENHRHMSLRQAKCLRKSHQFLIPIGPFMDQWGRDLGASTLLSTAEKAEIIAALFAGHQREEQAIGYARAYGALVKALPAGLNTLEQDMPVDLIREIKTSPFHSTAEIPLPEFEQDIIKRLNNFVCPITKIQF